MSYMVGFQNNWARLFVLKDHITSFKGEGLSAHINYVNIIKTGLSRILIRGLTAE